MSGIVAFFGHRETEVTYALEEKLERVVIELINNGYDEFWCCEQGNFDWLSRMVLLRIKEQYKRIRVCYICAYDFDKFSTTRQRSLEENFEIICPFEALDGPPRFAIGRRNKYIAENADVIVCYLTSEVGGAAQAVKIAKKNEKQIINLAGY